MNSIASPSSHPASASSTPSSTRQNSLSSQASDGSHSNSSTQPTRSINSIVRTRGNPFSACVDIERPPYTGGDDEVIFVVVRLSDKFDQSSRDGAAELPGRPRPRSFLERLNTRFGSPVASQDANGAARRRQQEFQYKSIWMPRREYYRHFCRDAHGNYAGTEPQQEWDLADLMREFGQWQSPAMRKAMDL